MAGKTRGVVCFFARFCQFTQWDGVEKMGGLFIFIVVIAVVLAAVVMLIGGLVVLLNWQNRKKDTVETEIDVTVFKFFKIHITHNHKAKK